MDFLNWCKQKPHRGSTEGYVSGLAQDRLNDLEYVLCVWCSSLLWARLPKMPGHPGSGGGLGGAFARESNSLHTGTSVTKTLALLVGTCRLFSGKTRHVSVSTHFVKLLKHAHVA